MEEIKYHIRGEPVKAAPHFTLWGWLSAGFTSAASTMYTSETKARRIINVSFVWMSR